jgi:hypothetical protein
VVYSQGLNKVTNVGLVAIAKHCSVLRILHANGRLNFDKIAGNVVVKAQQAVVKRDLIANGAFEAPAVRSAAIGAGQ